MKRRIDNNQSYFDKRKLEYIPSKSLKRIKTPLQRIKEIERKIKLNVDYKLHELEEKLLKATNRIDYINEFREKIRNEKNRLY